MASIAQAQHAVTLGCKLITHLFNAMVPVNEWKIISYDIQFHHRDPGVVGLLGSRNHKIHYSMIVDDVHSHYSCVTIAYDAHPKGTFFFE